MRTPWSVGEGVNKKGSIAIGRVELDASESGRAEWVGSGAVLMCLELESDATWR